jgi:hypothetical protein
MPASDGADEGERIGIQRAGHRSALPLGEHRRFFSGALKKELALAGYDLRSDSTRTVSGTIEQFFLDYVGQQDQRFKIQTTFQIARKDAPAFSTSCRSERQQMKDWMRSGSLIERGIKDCIEEFMKTAQAAGAL